MFGGESAALIFGVGFFSAMTFPSITFQVSFGVVMSV
jgi:hypothetical protein